MVTLCYFFTFVLLIMLTAFFDMRLFEYSIWEALKNLLYTEIAVGRLIVLIGAVIGLSFSMVADIRLYLKKKKSRQEKGNQA
ncbi:hypothetical protein RCG23_05665 [Neobacillus sp. PS3-34]|uniref:hypothetical protein n=1 Tax=Neobacillus sp. PS3-34 TaxID=3070678 RepID=UPI0027DF9EE3|nr:hypothetical protein [Neobacillus sp. PS3-34]WML49488.1 hypothetical protein RCG23_05665 [Neobacillus sp. PS3-34]